MRIAICDDEDFIYEQLRDYIRYAMVENKIRDQVEIVYFSSGEKLIQSYKNHKRFDILFLDIAMRRLDGITVGRPSGSLMRMQSLFLYPVIRSVRWRPLTA